MNILSPDLRRELLYADEEEIVQRVLKCAEIIIKFNKNVTVSALIDTGSAVNGLSEAWFHQNQKDLIPYEELPMTNTLILSAVGNKSRLIRKQIMCEIYINDVKMDCVFLIIPNLIRPCILGISFLKEEGCFIDVAKGVVGFKGRAEETEFTLPIMHMEVMNEEEGEEIEEKINDKIDSIVCEDREIIRNLKEILIKNKSLFRECPGKIDGYEHEFSVSDSCLLYTSRCV